MFDLIERAKAHGITISLNEEFALHFEYDDDIYDHLPTATAEAIINVIVANKPQLLEFLINKNSNMLDILTSTNELVERMIGQSIELPDAMVFDSSELVVYLDAFGLLFQIDKIHLSTAKRGDFYKVTGMISGFFADIEGANFVKFNPSKTEFLRHEEVAF